MGSDKRRIRRGVAIGGGIAVVAIGVTWFTVLPYAIQEKVNASLAQTVEKTGRKVSVEGVRLTGLSSAFVRRITVSDVGAPERTGVRFDGVKIALDGMPVGSDFRVTSVEADDIEVTLRVDGGKTNFEDVLDMMRTKTPSGDRQKPKSAWKRYVTPFPEVHIDSVSLTMQPYEVRKGLSVGAVALSSVEIAPTEGATQMAQVEVPGAASALLVEDGTPTTYESRIEGRIDASDTGRISVSFPRSQSGSEPAFLTQDGVRMSFEQLHFVLPTTFEADRVLVSERSDTLVEADKVRVRLMSLPPKKVSGVYFKEIELVRPVVHEYMRSGDSALTHWVKSLQNAWRPAGRGESVKSPAKPKAPKDYFFTQRLFVTDGRVVVGDQRTRPMVNVEVGDIQLEVGYRSIRRLLDYRIEFGLVEPLVSDILLSGRYSMQDETVEGSLDIGSLRPGDSLKKFQVNLREPKNGQVVGKARDTLRAATAAAELREKSGADTLKVAAAMSDDPSEDVLDTIAKKLLPSIDLSEARLKTHIGYRYAVEPQSLSLDASLSTSGGLIQMGALSHEPMAIEGMVGVRARALFKEPSFFLDDVELSLGGSSLRLGGSLSKAVHEVRVKGNRDRREPQESWRFRLTADLDPQPMQVLFDAIPHALRSELDGLTWTGSLGLHFETHGFFDAISEAQHQFNLTMSEDFGVTGWPSGRSLAQLNDGFVHHVVDPNALNPHDIVIPPSIYPVVIDAIPVYTPRLTADDIREMYPEWVLFDDLNPWLVQLITTTEDGSFFTHDGFSPLQIKAAIERNLSRGEFSRGASTISMQLIKNLYFDRTKSVSRKLQEVLYTWLMESVVRIPKKRIMEVYFNIIEFGPEIYGIEEAAKYYFGKRSQALTLKECAFLMAIIPRPRKGEVYRSQAVLGKGLQRTINFYINAMYARKCDPDMLATMRARFAKRGIPVPFEPCCPPKTELDAMLEADSLGFYLPDPKDPLKYGYRPDWYDETGHPLVPIQGSGCRARGHMEDMASVESIFETLSTDELPAQETAEP